MRVLVVSHDPLTRRAMADLLARLTGVEVVGSIEPRAAATLQGPPSTPDIVLWEATGEPGDLRRVRDLVHAGQAVAALVMTDEQARRVRAAGAVAVLPRSVDIAALQAAMVAALEGLAVSDPTLEPSALDSPDLDPVENLTPRELEVLRLIAEGLSNKAIAARLGIRESTVKDHVNSMLDKLGARSRTEAVTGALRRGLIAI